MTSQLLSSTKNTGANDGNQATELHSDEHPSDPLSSIVPQDISPSLKIPIDSNN